MIRTTCVFCLLVLSSCGSATGGRPVDFTMQMELVTAPGDADGDPRTFTVNDFAVELTSIRLEVGAIYLFEKQPLVDARRWLDTLGNALLPAAHAHPGDSFFAGGRALGEWVSAFTYELDRDDDTLMQLGDVEGIAGWVRSFSIVFAARGTQVGHVAIAGTATRAETTIPFRMTVTFPADIESRRLDFASATVELSESGALLVRANPAAWFEGAMFERLSPPVATSTVELDPDDQVHRAVTTNLRRGRPYSLEWQQALP